MSSKVITFKTMYQAVSYLATQPEGTKLLIVMKHAYGCHEGERRGISATKCTCATVYEVQPLTDESLSRQIAEERGIAKKTLS